MFEVKTEAYFSSAHRLLNYEGQCENLHGHNWKVEVYAQGDNLDKSNILIDFKLLKKVLNDILDTLDHKVLNEIEAFKTHSPSSEMIAKHIYEQIKPEIPQITKVYVWETATSRAGYWE
jgi:6-pyruvoyltetrahydropterin/6-carboxytetrahydropterin synthase